MMSFLCNPPYRFMFDIFRKRAAPSKAVISTSEQSTSSQADYAERKRAALVEAETAAHEETTALDFILKCEFADARLLAAQSVQSRPALEKILQAMRNTDRRVAKLMQSRLDALQMQEAANRQAERCIAIAQALLSESVLSPSQVSELDREWQSIRDMSATDRAVFDTTRETLRKRLEGQTALQREVLDALAELRALAAEDIYTSSEEIARRLKALESKVTACRSVPEAQSLPKNLLNDFEQTADMLSRNLRSAELDRQAYSSRQERLAAWESAELADLQPDLIKREWQSFPASSNSDLMAPLQSRFDDLLKRLGESRRPSSGNPKRRAEGAIAQIDRLLDDMEAALAEGSLQLASEHDKALRALDVKDTALPSKQSARMTRVRAELKRMQGWARWGGHVSREELLLATEALIGQSLQPTELARKVGSMRERWRSLDISAGPAGKELWQRFDQACTAAYAPAAAHFKQQAEERKENAQKAQALIDELRRFSKQVEGDLAQTDWKEVGACLDRSKQAWHRLGGIDRKEKKRLDAEFDAAVQTLAAPLTQRRDEEYKWREQLIAEVQGLNPKDRSSTEALRAIQERWQQQAKALPLERKDEQALWKRFRQTCDEAFAARREISQALDAERRANLQKKEAWCTQLESVKDLNEPAIRKLLLDVEMEWDRIGPVPRDSERQIETRYRKSVEHLRKQLDQLRRNIGAAKYDALLIRLKLCWALEKRASADKAAAQSETNELVAAWGSAPETFKELKADLAQRFDVAMKAVQVLDPNFAALLEQNRSGFLRELLRLEIVCGVSSPSEFSQERLRLQVDVLQSALKTGQIAQNQSKGPEIFRDIVRLPATMDEVSAARIERLVQQRKA